MVSRSRINDRLSTDAQLVPKRSQKFWKRWQIREQRIIWKLGTTEFDGTYGFTANPRPTWGARGRGFKSRRQFAWPFSAIAAILPEILASIRKAALVPILLMNEIRSLERRCGSTTVTLRWANLRGTSLVIAFGQLARRKS